MFLIKGALSFYVLVYDTSIILISSGEDVLSCRSFRLPIQKYTINSNFRLGLTYSVRVK